MSLSETPDNAANLVLLNPSVLTHNDPHQIENWTPFLSEKETSLWPPHSLGTGKGVFAREELGIA